MSAIRRLTSTLGMLACLSGLAVAADKTPQPLPPPKSAWPTTDRPAEGWIITLGVMGAVTPSFPGSAKLRPYPFPFVNVRRIGEPERFSTPDDGFGFALLDTDYVRAGPVANFVFRRGGRDGLAWLRQIGTTHEIGGFIEATPTENLRARVELRQGIDGHHGFVASFGADVHGAVSSVHLSAGPRLSFGDNRYANAYYSVSPFEAMMNGRLLPYSATGGFTAAGGVATARFDVNERTSATIFGGAQRLLGSVGDSPIPAMLGSRNQFNAGLSIARSFEIRTSDYKMPW